ncbi:MAG: hypothetical protein AB1Z22_02895 [Synechococcaceae cyanobacterium]
MEADPLSGALTPAEVRELDSTLLPALERHHLRLLAHGLRTLQAAADRRGGPLPDAGRLRRWVQSQPQAAEAPEFAHAFLRQLQNLAAQLEAIAAERHCDPLALTLDQLVQWARSRADQRTSSHTPTRPSPAASQPPVPG